MKLSTAFEEVKGDFASLIDMSFLLLIFFMCAAKFKTFEGKLVSNLPKDMGEDKSAAPPPDVTPRRVELKVKEYMTMDGKKITESIYVMLGDQNLGTYKRPRFAVSQSEREQLLAQRDVIYTDLQEKLRQMEVASDPSKRTPTFIAPDLRVPADDVMQALNAVLAAGIKDLTFAGKVSDLEKLRKEDGISE